MKLIKRIGSLFFIAPALAWAGGGMVGNGAGLAEQNFIYAYESLPTSIGSCFENPKCAFTLSADETQALKQIAALARDNSLARRPLIFISGKINSGFFDLSSTENFRIAKTGLSADAPIWINTDLIYKADGAPSLDFAASTAILIHEVGHQTGRADHAFLDLLAAKIRAHLLSNQMRYELPLNGETLGVLTIDFSLPTESTDIFSTYGDHTARLNALVATSIHCDGDFPTPMGFKVSNGHWDLPVEDSAGNTRVAFKAWLRFSCLKQGVLNFQSGDLSISFTLSPSREGASQVSDIRASVVPWTR